eukprot:COSAG05_NODE_547_length_8758_cov_288.331447_6_plen_154_part_00
MGGSCSKDCEPFAPPVVACLLEGQRIATEFSLELGYEVAPACVPGCQELIDEMYEGCQDCEEEGCSHDTQVHPVYGMSFKGAQDLGTARTAGVGYGGRLCWTGPWDATHGGFDGDLGTSDFATIKAGGCAGAAQTIPSIMFVAVAAAAGHFLR